MSNFSFSEKNFFYYFNELRNRLIKSLLSISIIFLSLLPFSNFFYKLLALPLIKQLPIGSHLIATNLMSPLTIPLKLLFLLSIFFAIPILLYQIWQFLAPALYKNEKKLFLMTFPLSLLLFYLGVLFAYCIIFPLLFKFLIQTVPTGISISPDISEYLDLTLQLFLIFGFLFQTPLFIILLTSTKIITLDKLTNNRSYFFVASFFIAMIFSPPDVISQILFAIPLYILFEIGIFLAKWVNH
ncbi:MAG: Sec-independent protein translocase protein TatC [Legionellaceae bacterium]